MALWLQIPQLLLKPEKETKQTSRVPHGRRQTGFSFVFCLPQRMMILYLPQAASSQHSFEAGTARISPKSCWPITSARQATSLGVCVCVPHGIARPRPRTRQRWLPQHRDARGTSDNRTSFLLGVKGSTCSKKRASNHDTPSSAEKVKKDPIHRIHGPGVEAATNQPYPALLSEQNIPYRTSAATLATLVTSPARNK